MPKKLRVGVIGCGEVAQIIHLPTLRDLSQFFEVTALCDISAAVLEAIAAEWPDASTHTDYRDLLAEDAIDIVLVANPHVFHAEVALAAMSAGKHVLIEKPVCITLEEIDKLVEAEKRHDVVAQVGFMRRHAPAFAEAVQRLDALRDDIIVARVHDVIGQNSLIIDSTSLVHRPKDVPDDLLVQAKQGMSEATMKAIGVSEGPKATAYALLLGLASHDVSAMRELIGLPEKVLCATQHQGGRAVTATFEYGQFACQFQTAVDQIPHFDAFLEVSTVREIVRVEYDTPYIRHQPTRLRILKPHGTAGISDETSFPSRYDSFAIEWRNFHDYIEQGKTPKTSLSDAREDLVLFQDMIALMN